MSQSHSLGLNTLYMGYCSDIVAIMPIKWVLDYGMWIDWSNIYIYKESPHPSILLTVVIINSYTNNIYNQLWRLKRIVGSEWHL